MAEHDHATSQPLNFMTEQFMPHGHCYLWKAELVWVHVISDLLIALAYASIPAALIYFVIQRRDLVFNWVFVLFGVFILACGATHVMAIAAVWEPAYYLQAAVKVLTAIASVATAIALWPLMPKLLALPSPAQLQAVNSELEKEVEENKSARMRLLEQSRELKTKSNEIEKINSELQKSNENLNDFAAIVAHDLQEPVRKIQRFAKQALGTEAASLPEPTAESLSRLSAVSERMRRLIDKLLQRARAEDAQIDLQELDTGAILNETLEDLDDMLERTGGEIKVLTDMPTVIADASGLHQVFQNLITNALKFHRVGEKPVVEIAAQSTGEIDSLGCTATKFTVRDNGIGIAEKHLEKIFDDFQRIHSREEYDGTGLGLSVCKKIIEAHGGMIEVFSTEGAGTTFQFYLPDTQQDLFRA